MNMIKIGFFGTPELAKYVLNDLYNDSRFEISFVVTGIDKPIGRSQKIMPTPVKEFAETKNIDVLQPLKLRGNDDFFSKLRSYNVDYIVVVAYGKIIPTEILTMPKKICINVHGSILPKYRGASPIQSSLIFGDSETGVTIMKMSEGMDEGDIISIKKIQIEKFDTTKTLFDKFSQESGNFLINSIIELEKGNLGFTTQISQDATYCKKITKEDGILDFNNNSESLFYLWRGLTPWPGIYTFFEEKKLIITSCDFLEEEIEGKIGEVIKGDFGVGIKCKKGVLVLKEVKLEGKGNQEISQFVNGRKNFVGYVL